jgi:hypothetical protein
MAFDNYNWLMYITEVYLSDTTNHKLLRAITVGYFPTFLGLQIFHPLAIAENAQKRMLIRLDVSCISTT